MPEARYNIGWMYIGLNIAYILLRMSYVLRSFNRAVSRYVKRFYIRSRKLIADYNQKQKMIAAEEEEDLRKESSKKAKK